MTKRIIFLALSLTTALAAPAQARTGLNEYEDQKVRGELPAVLQCVPFARQLTGVQIYGDAHTWWGQAAGRYGRGKMPRPGAVMAIRPYGNSRLGHVAAVERVLDTRTVLISHANWSSPGQIERMVKAVDVSPLNDWSEVRIWFGPNQALGSRHWPVYGFIYGEKAKASPPQAPAPREDLIADIIAGRYG